MDEKFGTFLVIFLAIVCADLVIKRLLGEGKQIASKPTNVIREPETMDDYIRRHYPNAV